jgi:hypothetical protein
MKGILASEFDPTRRGTPPRRQDSDTLAGVRLGGFRLAGIGKFYIDWSR